MTIASGIIYVLIVVLTMYALFSLIESMLP